MVRELGLSEADEQEGSGPRIRIDALTLGSARFVEVEAEVRDLNEIWGDGSPSGVFGFDLFGDRLVTLDLPLQKLLVFDGELPAPDGQEILSYSLHSRIDELGERQVPTIEIGVAGRTLSVELSPLGFGTLALPKNQMEQFPLASEAGVIGRPRTRMECFRFSEPRWKEPWPSEVTDSTTLRFSLANRLTIRVWVPGSLNRSF